MTKEGVSKCILRMMNLVVTVLTVMRMSPKVNDNIVRYYEA